MMGEKKVIYLCENKIDQFKKKTKKDLIKPITI